MKNTFLSLTIIVTEDIQESVIEKYSDFLRKSFSDYEILLIDYKDNNNFSAKSDDILKTIEKVRYLKITDVFNEEIAMAAAMENAIGDIIVIGTLDNLTESVIIQGVDRCFEGVDIVIGCSNIRAPLWYKLGSYIYRSLTKYLIHYDFPTNDTKLRFISRRAANAIMSSKKFHHHLLLLMFRCGFKTEELDYKTSTNSLSKDTSFLEAFSRGVSLLVFNSTRPLRLANLLGLLASLMSLLIATYSILVRFIKHNVVEGWTTLILFTSIQFFMLFIISSFLGEYLVRILLDKIDQSAYNVVFEKHSSVMLDMEKINVLSESTTDNINLSQTGRDR